MEEIMKKALAMLLAVVMVLALCACGQAAAPAAAPAEAPAAAETVAEAVEEASTDDLIGIVLPTKEESYWLGCQKYLEQELAGYNFEILYSQHDSAVEKTNVETFINKGAKYLVFCAYDAEAAASTAEEAKQAGLTVICYDRLIMNTDAVDYYVTFDSKAVGRAQAKYLIEKAAGEKDINFYMYCGALTDNNSILFFEGVWEVLQPALADGTFTVRNCDKAVELKDNPTPTRDELVSIMQTIDTEWSMPTCKNLAEAHLAAVDADAKGRVFVLGPQDDDCARALSDAFHADADVTEVIVTGADGTEGSVQYIIDGLQSMTVYKDTVNLAKGTRTIIEALVNGQEPETNSTYPNGAKDVPAIQTDVVTVTADNIVEVFFDSGVYDGSKYTGWQK